MRLIKCEAGRAGNVADALWQMKKDEDYRVGQLRDTNEFRNTLKDPSEIEGWRLFVILRAESEEEMKDIVKKIESLPYVVSTREWAWQRDIPDRSANL